MIVSLNPECVLTANHRYHWAAKARLTKALRTRGVMAWRLAGSPQYDRARLVVTLGYPDRRHRDAANLHPTVKALIDGMVHPAPGVRGVLPDDSDAYLTGPDLRPGDVTPGRFTFTFDFTEETQP